MKIFQKFGLSLIFISAFAVFAVAQTEKTESVASNKIAVINSTLFEDKEKGIKELVDAYAKLEEEFTIQKNELINLENKIRLLKEELKQKIKIAEDSVCLPNDFKSNFDKQYAELVRLDARYKEAELFLTNIYKKREMDVINPIKTKITEVLKQFAKENGYDSIFDISNFTPLSYPQVNDITKDFINYYNSLPIKQ